MEKLETVNDDRLLSGKHLMSGNEAVAEGALAAGVEGYFGYPITPSTSIMEHLIKRISKFKNYFSFLQSEDEIASITAVIGCSWTRKKSMTATSGPGFSLMQEGIGLAAFTETPLVLINVMRGGPSTGLPTFPGQQELMQTHFGSHGDYLIPTLVPGSVQECFDFTVEAFNISEAFRTPVFVLSDQVLSGLKELLTIPEKVEIVDRAVPGKGPVTYKGEEISEVLVPAMNCFGEDKKSFSTGLSHNETGHVDLSADNYDNLINRQHQKITQYEHLLPQPKLQQTDDADIIVVAYGSTARACRLAIKRLRRENHKIGIFTPTTVWPFPEKQLNEVTKGRKVLVVEMSIGQLIWPVERYLHRKVEHIGHTRGQIPPPSLIEKKLKEMLKEDNN